MKVEKETKIEELVGNDDNKAVKSATKKRKTTQFSTTIQTELFEEMSEMMETHGLDRTQVITILFNRLVSDSEYTVGFLFPKQEQITTQQITTKEHGQEDNFEV